ncbi:hypothetical protein ACTXT7_001548 [Hymenolepis weldensis]
MNIADLCGDTPLEVTDLLNVEDPQFYKDNAFLPPDESFPELEHFSPVIKAFNINWNLLQNAKTNKPETDSIGLNQDGIKKLWHPDRVQYFPSLFRGNNTDNYKAHLRTLYPSFNLSRGLASRILLDEKLNFYRPLCLVSTFGRSAHLVGINNHRFHNFWLYIQAR